MGMSKRQCLLLLIKLNDKYMFRNQYDTDVTSWSPAGRLFQVEYAMEAVKQGSAAIVLLADKAQALVQAIRSCQGTNDTVHDAVKQMAPNNIGSLVVLKPGDQASIAEFSQNENKLTTLTSDTNILQAMQVMTENQIRHVPMVDGRIVGMVSIVGVVGAVVEQQNREVKRLKEFIKRDYY